MGKVPECQYFTDDRNLRNRANERPKVVRLSIVPYGIGTKSMEVQYLYMPDNQ